MHEKTDGKLATPQCRYKDHHDRHARTTSFRRVQRVYAGWKQLRVTAAARLATDLYLKLLPQKLVPYCILPTTIEPVTIDDERIPNTILAGPLSLEPRPEEDGSTTS